MKSNPKSGGSRRTPHSVLLTAEEDRRIANVAARLTLERGTVCSKSAIMREAILYYAELFENGKGKNVAKETNHKTKTKINSA